MSAGRLICALSAPRASRLCSQRSLAVLSERPICALRASCAALSRRPASRLVLPGRIVCVLRASRVCSQGVSSVLSMFSGRLDCALSALRASQRSQGVSSVHSVCLVSALRAARLCFHGVPSVLSGRPVLCSRGVPPDCRALRLVLSSVSACALKASRLVLSWRPVYALRSPLFCSQSLHLVACLCLPPTISFCAFLPGQTRPRSLLLRYRILALTSVAFRVASWLRLVSQFSCLAPALSGSSFGNIAGEHQESQPALGLHSTAASSILLCTGSYIRRRR